MKKNNDYKLEAYAVGYGIALLWLGIIALAQLT
jgi:hypothetical protein